MTTTEPRTYPFSEPEKLDLDPFYARLREQEPLSRISLPYGENAWLATRYEDAKIVLGDPRFSRAAVFDHDGPRMGPNPERAGLLTMDPPDHTRLRKLVAKAFTARRVEKLRPRTQEIADGLVDRMLEQADRPTWSRISRCRCRSPSSANCSACPMRIVRTSASGRTRSCPPRSSPASR